MKSSFETFPTFIYVTLRKRSYENIRASAPICFCHSGVFIAIAIEVYYR